MKLITKTILYFILISIPILIGTSMIAYHKIADTVEESTREILWNDKTKAEDIIKNSVMPDNLILSFDSLSTIRKDTTSNTGFRYLDLYKMDVKEDEMVNYRALISYYKNGKTNYLISVMRPVMEEDDLIENLINILLLMIGALVLTFFLVNLFLSRHLWKPFSNTLQALNDFELISAKKFDAGFTKTKEFRQLNEVLVKMTDKMQKDYRLQKEFTENASHEMQTPLAVMKAKVEQLMQSQRLCEEELLSLQDIENSINRLSALNKSLLLLAKIENHQFREAEDINLKAGVSRILVVWEDIIKEKNIALSVHIKEDAKVKMHGVLFDILINNLIQNAIRHNHKNGEIRVDGDYTKLVFSNSGRTLITDSEAIFGRFKKGDTTPESTGLGLAIVRSIIDVYKYKICYFYNENKHNFKMEF